MSTRGTMVQCFFLHAVHVAALCLLLFFHLIELRAWLTLWLIAVSLAASLTYALLAAAVGPHIPRRPALAHLVVAGNVPLLLSSCRDTFCVARLVRRIRSLSRHAVVAYISGRGQRAGVWRDLCSPVPPPVLLRLHDGAVGHAASGGTPLLSFSPTSGAPCRAIQHRRHARIDSGKQPMKKRLLAFFIFFGCSFGIASLIYHLMALLTFGGFIFGILPRMFCYHWEYPNHYIALVCLIYALLAAAFTPCIARRPSLAIWIVLAAPLLASPLGGMLWHLHDMLTGYFPNSWLEKLLLDGALEGAGLGWLIVLLSVPFNLICAILGIRGTRRVALSLYPASATTSPPTPGDEPAAPSPVQA